jgi:hypothetical protein
MRCNSIVAAHFFSLNYLQFASTKFQPNHFSCINNHNNSASVAAILLNKSSAQLKLARCIFNSIYLRCTYFYSPEYLSTKHGNVSPNAIK